MITEVPLGVGLRWGRSWMSRWRRLRWRGRTMRQGEGGLKCGGRGHWRQEGWAVGANKDVCTSQGVGGARVMRAMRSDGCNFWGWQVPYSVSLWKKGCRKLQQSLGRTWLRQWFLAWPCKL